MLQVALKTHCADTRSEPFRGGRGGRGGGRGGYGNANGGSYSKKDNDFPTSTETTTDGWASQVQQSDDAEAATTGGDGGWGTAAAAVDSADAGAGGWGTDAPAQADDGGWGTAAPAQASQPEAGGWGTDAPPVEASQADDFAAAGGFSDAPAPKEIVAAAKQGDTRWEEEIKKPVPAVKPKLTWAQIAK